MRTDKDKFAQKTNEIKSEYIAKEKELDEKKALKNKELAQIETTINWLKHNKLTPGNDVHKYIEDRTYQINLLAFLFEAVMKKNDQLTEKITEAREEKNNYKNKAKEYKRQIEHLTKLQSKLHGRIKFLVNKNDELNRIQRNKIQLKNTFPQELINILINNCFTENLADYKNLDNLVKYYQSVLKLTKRKDYSYGYVERNNAQYLLHDINKNTVYPIIIPDKYRTDSRFDSGIVVRCDLIDDVWVVDHLYPTISVKQNEHKNLKKKEKNCLNSTNYVKNQHEIKITNDQELMWLKKLNVVLVGNKYSSGFVSEIKKYCHLKIFDAYEDGEQQIFRAMHTADYVFVLIGSVPHSITVYTKSTKDLGENSNKVQIFDVPAKYDGVIRLHYLYVNHADKADSLL